MSTELRWSCDRGEALSLPAFTDTPRVGEWGRDNIALHIENHPWVALIGQGQTLAVIFYMEVHDVVEICYLETLPDFRRKGHMHRLLSLFIQHFSSRTLWLDVRSENAQARALYAKLGFKNNGLRRGYYKDGSDGLLMEKPSTA